MPPAKPAAEKTSRKYLRQSPTEFIHALARTKLPGEATRLMAFLYDRANPEKPLAFLKLRAAAREMRIGEQPVRRALQALEARGFINVKIQPSGTRIILVNPLPAPDKTSPDDWAAQIEQAYNELRDDPPIKTDTPPIKTDSPPVSGLTGGAYQNRQPSPINSVRENRGTPGPERGSADLITVLNHTPESRTSNHSPSGGVQDLSLVVNDTAEQCRKILGWSWDAQSRSEQQKVVEQLLRDGHTAADVVACVEANRNEIKASLRYLGPLLPRWKAARGLPPGLATCFRCGLPVLMTGGDLLRGLRAGDQWMHRNCSDAKNVKKCHVCRLPIDPLVSWRKYDRTIEEGTYESTSPISGFELRLRKSGPIFETHDSEECKDKAYEMGEREYEAYDEAHPEPAAAKAGS